MHLHFAPGQAATEVSGDISGYQQLVFQFDGVAQREVTVELSHPGPASLYHNVIAPSGEMVFNGSMDGKRFQARLGESGSYRVQVYLMRNDARRGKRIAFTLRLRQSAAQAPARPGTPTAAASSHQEPVA